MIERRGFLGAVIGGLLAVFGVKSEKKLRWTGGAAVAHVKGKTCVWIGAKSLAWGDRRNWIDGKSPVNGDTVILRKGSGHLDMDNAPIYLECLIVEQGTSIGNLGNRTISG